ncbi:MAG: hypothetical protein COC01_02120 [Bacteroidetes bacterium]|nr:MAG: hypothetical protein COC01_02120 [Bacteroidota bacterium]
MDFKRITVVVAFVLGGHLGFAQLSSTLVSTNVTCKDSCNGSAILTPSGGTSPYTYNWSNGQTDSTTTGLCVGTYYVTVYDAISDSLIDTAVITEPDTLSISITSTDCSGYGVCDGSIKITLSGGTLPYLYSIDNGATFVADSIFDSLCAGTYYVYVDDQYNCPGYLGYCSSSCTGSGSGNLMPITVVIGQPPPLGATGIVSDASCYLICDGAITVTASGGVPPYSYSIDNGATFQSSNYLFGLCAYFPYDFVVQDANLNQVVTGTFIAGEAGLPMPGSWSTTNVFCNGNCNGSIEITSVSGAGGGGPYEYSIDKGITFQNSNVFNSVCPGSYILVVRDFIGCQTMYPPTVIITEPTVLSIDTVTSSNVICNGDSTGTANVTTNGGTTPYTYAWSNGTTTSNISNLAAATHYVTVTDNNGCIAVDSTIITEPAVLIVDSISTTDIFCNGDSSGAANAAVNGGTTPYAYTWSNGETASSINNLAATIYYVTVTDNNGCTAVNSATITEPDTLSISITSTDCSGYGVCDGTITITLSGGTFPYLYSIDSGATFVADSVFYSLCAGTYYVYVDDQYNCPGYGSGGNQMPITVVIGQPSPPPLSIWANVTHEICPGDCMGAIQIIASGGVPPYQYTFDGGAFWGNSGFLSPLGTNFLCGGGDLYYLGVMDANGNTYIDAMPTVVNYTSEVYTNILPTNITCNSACNGLIYFDDFFSPTYPPLQYSIDNGASFQNNPTFTGLCPGTYDLVVVDNQGCQWPYPPVTLTEPTVLSIDTITSSNVICNGDSTGTANVTTNGGTTPYAYNWSNGDTASSISNLAAATHYVTVTDNNVCIAVDSAIITEPTALSIDNVFTTDVMCNGNSSGTANVTTNGGITPYAYAWSNGESASSISNLAAAIYNVTVTDNYGCVADDIAIISEPAYIDSTTGIIICQNDSIFIGGNWQSSEGFYFDTLTASNGCDSVHITDLTIKPVYSPVVSIQLCAGDSVYIGGSWQADGGIYYDTLSSIDGCDSIITTELSFNQSYSNNQSVTICVGDSLLIAGSWVSSTGIYYDTLQTTKGCDSIITLSLTINNSIGSTLTETACNSYDFGGNLLTTSGTYYDTLVNTLGCDSMIILNLTVLPSLSVNVNMNICEGDSIILGGNWQTQAGLYYDTLQTVTGCDSVIGTSLTVVPLPSISINGLNNVYCTTDDAVTIMGSPNGGTFSGPGIDNNIFSPAAADTGTHIIIYTYTDANGCTDSVLQQVIVDACTGMADFSNKNKAILQIAPNPFNQTTKITLHSEFNSGNRQLIILDVTGRKVKGFPIGKEDQAFTINATEIGSGLFFVQLIADGEVIEIEKMIVVR